MGRMLSPAAWRVKANEAGKRGGWPETFFVDRGSAGPRERFGISRHGGGGNLALREAAQKEPHASSQVVQADVRGAPRTGRFATPSFTRRSRLS